MYRVEIIRPNANGFCPWQVMVGVNSLSGRSRQPLLDACREIKRIGGDPLREVGLFREGKSNWDLKCKVGVGAQLGVNEKRKSAGFVKWQPFNRDIERLEAAE